MAWKVELDPAAERELDKIDPQTARRILAFLHGRIAQLDDPRSGSMKTIAFLLLLLCLHSSVHAQSQQPDGPSPGGTPLTASRYCTERLDVYNRVNSAGDEHESNRSEYVGRSALLPG